MAFDISQLPAYVEQNRSELAAAALLSPKFASRVSTMEGVYGPTTLNNADAGIQFQDGSGCGWNAKGNDKFSQRQIIPGYMKVNKSYCHKDLKNTYAVHETRTKAGFEKLPFEQFFMKLNTKKIALELEKALFNGDKTNGTGNLAYVDGLMTLIGRDITNNVIVSDQIVAKGSDSVLARTRKTFTNIPEEVIEDSEIWMSYANYRQLVEDLIAANNYHFTGEFSSNFEMILPGTETKIVGMPGMRGNDEIISVVPQEIFYGYDEADSANTYDLWFSKDNDEFRFKGVFVAGVNYRFPEHLIINR